ncbi:MAG: Re/Si-specific NAD(P)(+) transhydrogenase subunit alpha [Candidatus Eremiobacteraeota bacterium]|nr:Re/Si-specific NAD(P)(+) transhydrogenase subunit alpha [Candidatus Eremiobacteraeota bacterium]
MNIAVPRESDPEESRVALVPESVSKLVKTGACVRVQSGAGERAYYPNELYTAAGAAVVEDPLVLLSAADLVVKVGRPSSSELEMMHEGTALLAFLAPLGDPNFVHALAERKLTTLSMDAIPRITRAQSMDALSSQSNIAGYKAVLIAAATLPRFFPMLTTAAGTVAPAKVLILGAGVAGLQAIATARRLGAVVSGYDTRAVVKEQVMSLGASFLEFDLGADAQGAGGYAKELSAEQIDRQRCFMVQHIGASDVVITTALVPGKRAPLLITEEAVRAMKPGSVIVDVAAEAGGNCALTKPAQTTVAHGVTIVGQTNLASSVAHHASQLYSRNVLTLLTHLLKDGNLVIDLSDEITRGTCLTYEGKIIHEPTLAVLAGAEVIA